MTFTLPANACNGSVTVSNFGDSGSRGTSSTLEVTVTINGTPTSFTLSPFSSQTVCIPAGTTGIVVTSITDDGGPDDWEVDIITATCP